MGAAEKPLRVGVIGCGAIVQQYLDSFPRLEQALHLVAVADLDVARAEAVAAQPYPASRGVRALSVDELLAADDVDVVLNLTIPAAHADVALRALAAGKHVYGEKPLAAELGDAAKVLAEASAKGLVVGCAPDTVLGTGVQTARAAIEDGAIGTPVAATATMVCPGHELWHPNPDFYYVPGGGPLLDMGPYYVSALVHMLGPVTRVTGAASQLRSERVIGSGERAGEVIPVSTYTHVTGTLTHASGAISTLVMSFDVVGTKAPNIEVHGTLASLVVPDPNHFHGPAYLLTLEDRKAGRDWAELAPSAGFAEAARGYGLADLAIRGGELRASGELAYHSLEVMTAVLRSADEGSAVAVESTVEVPPLVR
ncbi:Gfo/Idh/MocA family oxidoreductase [Micrococcales bacterium 31B]|nr:Gfo/Idh/MocA family oxidoreductase [Micrococcales bacterium 31B]